jgi:hypothetical protein
MRSGCNLRRRASAYQFRFALPRRLVSCCGRREIILGLRTTAYTLALKRARVETLMAEFDLITVRAEEERRVRGWVDAQIAAIENNLGAHGAAYLDADEAAALGPEFLDDMDALLRVAACVDHEKNFRPTIASLLSGGMAQIGGTGGTDDRTRAAARSRQPVRRKARDRGRRDRALAASRRAGAARASGSRPGAGKAVLRLETFVDDKRTQKDWKPDMPGNARSARNTFEGLIGDPPPKLNC